jgi:hypothetical protein
LLASPVFSSGRNNTLVLNRPSNYTGYLLQAQTISVNSGLGTNWFTVPGSESNSTFLAL